MNVHSIEIAIAKSIAEAMPQQTVLPQRPGYGMLGQPRILYANYVSLALGNRKMVCYRIRVEDTATGRAPGIVLAKRITAKVLTVQLLREHYPIATDYHSTVVSGARVPWKTAYRVTHQGTSEEATIFKVSFSQTGTLGGTEVIDYLNATNHEARLDSKLEVLQALNVILSQYLRNEDVSVGPSADHRFDVRSCSHLLSPLTSCMEILHRISIRTRLAAGHALLNVEAGQLIYYRAGLLLDIVTDYIAREAANIYLLEDFLKGVRVHLVSPTRNSSRQTTGTSTGVIRGLATNDDGKQLRHPPRVAYHGAGPKDVEIFLHAGYTFFADSPYRRGYIRLIEYFDLSKFALSFYGRRQFQS